MFVFFVFIRNQILGLWYSFMACRKLW